jgi:hypothetical protein
LLAAAGCRAPTGAGLAAERGRPAPAAVVRNTKVEIRVPRTGDGNAEPFVDLTSPSGRSARVFGYASGDS